MRDVTLYFVLQAPGDHQINYVASESLWKEFWSQLAELLCVCLLCGNSISETVFQSA